MDDDDIFDAPVVEDVDPSETVEEVPAPETVDAGDDDMDDMFNAEVPAEGGAEAEEEEDPFAAPVVEDVAEPAPAPAPVQQDSARMIFARKFRALVEERDSEESAKRQERVDRATGELDEWRSRRTEHRDITSKGNRESEADFLETIRSEKESSSSWAQVVKSIDTQANSDEDRTDAARMRSVLIQLKNNPLKPPISAAEPVEAAAEEE